MVAKTIYFIEMTDEKGNPLSEVLGPFENQTQIQNAIKELVNPSKVKKKRGRGKRLKMEDLDGYRKDDLKKILDVFKVPYMYKDTLGELKEKVLTIKELEELPKPDKK